MIFWSSLYDCIEEANGQKCMINLVQGLSPRDIFTRVQGLSPRDIFTRVGVGPRHIYKSPGFESPRHIYESPGFESQRHIYKSRGRLQTYLIKIRESNSGYIGSKTRKCILILLKAEAWYHTVCKVGCVKHGCVEIVSDAIGR